MSSIEKMVFVNIAGLTPDLDTVLVKLSECGCFHIESASKLTGREKGFSTLKEENPYASPLKLLLELAGKFGVKLEGTDYEDIEYEPLKKITTYLQGVHEKIDGLKIKQKLASEHLSVHEQALSQVVHLKGLNVDFQQIFACEHIKVRFGRLPIDSYSKFPYYDDKLFYFIKLSSEKEFIWGLYFTPVVCVGEIDEIFDSLYFERIRVPDFVQGNTEDALRLISKMVEDDKNELAETEAMLKEIYDSEKDKLDKIYSRLKSQHDNFALRNKASVVSDKFYIVGFVPKRDSDRFFKMFDDMPGVSVVMQPADVNGKLEPPIKLRNNKFAEPFSMFVNMYGLPSYNGINPTNFVAITYTLLFGIMFGDFGQGIIISILGALLWKWKRLALGRIMSRVGISSAVFGLLFGSVFGYEHLLDPLYEKIGISFLPFHAMHNINTVLYGAIGVGVLIIFISIIFNIIIGFRNKDFEKALFGNNGLAGFIFFGSILVGIVANFLGTNLFTAPYIVCLLILPVILMFMREPLSHWAKGKKYHMESGLGDFIASNFFEVFEFMLGYATNTLSFVRVGGFVLSHAGMMSVVMSLAESASASASPIVIVIGNIFVMGMEGMIVGIQVLRLEFYEVFSRFYDGNGQPFSPVHINYDNDDNIG